MARISCSVLTGDDCSAVIQEGNLNAMVDSIIEHFNDVHYTWYKNLSSHEKQELVKRIHDEYNL